MADRIAAALGGDLTMGQITRNELQRAKRRRPTDLTAYDYFLLGEEAKATVTPESVPMGIDYLNKAIELDPTFARAYSVRAWLHNFSLMTGVDWKTALGRMVADAEKAVELDPQDPESLATLGAARVLNMQNAEAEALLRSAVEMAPANSHVLVIAAGMFAALSLSEEAAPLADRAMRLDPRMTAANLTGVVDAYYFARRYEDTVVAVSNIPEASRTRAAWLFLAGSYARLDRDKEAGQAKAKLLKAYPNISAERMLNEDYFPWPKDEDTEHFIDTFRVAGLALCLSTEELREFPDPYVLPECDGQRAANAIAKT